MVIMQKKLADILPNQVLDPCAPALLSRADQLLLTRHHQQESDYPQRQPSPKIFSYFWTQIPPHVLQPLKKILKIHTKVAQSLPGPSACSVSYTHLTLPTISLVCRSRWSPYH